MAHIRELSLFPLMGRMRAVESVDKLLLGFGVEDREPNKRETALAPWAPARLPARGFLTPGALSHCAGAERVMPHYLVSLPRLPLSSPGAKS